MSTPAAHVPSPSTRFHPRVRRIDPDERGSRRPLHAEDILRSGQCKDLRIGVDLSGDAVAFNHSLAVMRYFAENCGNHHLTGRGKRGLSAYLKIVGKLGIGSARRVDDCSGCIDWYVTHREISS